MTWKGRWLALRARISRAPIVILISNGALECVRGTLPLPVKNDFAEVVRDRRVDDALLTVTKGTDGATLAFSGNLDESTKQRLRNVWFAYPERKMIKV